MIAEIIPSFVGQNLNRKIEYQIDKIEAGVARELYNSSGDTINNMYRNMSLVAGLNDRVKLPYIEFILNSPVGENLTDEKFLEVTKEYLERMGYGDSCYTVIKHDDKDHRHVHVLATTVDLNGMWISDSYSKGRSGTIMRELELKHGIEIMEKGKSSHNKSLGESQYRKYFFDSALHKALRSYNAKERIAKLLDKSDNFQAVNPDLGKAYTNTEWKVMLGQDMYEQILSVLSKGKFFNPLFKDELLSAMDRLYIGCKDVKEFRDKLEKENYYMRLISDKGKSYYVYGIPDRSFYLKDYALPERYRFGKISFSGQKMTVDEQKHYLYNSIFATLNESSCYKDFKERLSENRIKLVEHVNEKGVYGLSFVQEGIDTPVQFKASDISKRLTYHNIQHYFSQQRSTGNKSADTDDQKDQKNAAPKMQSHNKEDMQWRKTAIYPVTEQYANNRVEWEREVDYMYPIALGIVTYQILDHNGKRRKDDDDNLPNKKKKKKRNKGLSI